MSDFNTPIMLLFFNRPDVLSELFDWVRTVKPKQLFLVQDGAREGNENDRIKIEECRKVVENVDWECDVKRNYSDVNLTCDHREYTGIDWCFQFVDRLIILEDDCLPSVSFYRFCGELLEKYKDDERVHMISGFNRCNHYEKTPYDYIFSKIGAGIGWATWKRVWDKVRALKEEQVFASSEEYAYFREKTLENGIEGGREVIYSLVETKKKDEIKNRVSSWELLVGSVAELNGSLTITPKKNLIKYNGITEDATHCYSDAMLLTKKIRKVLTQCSYELDLPIKHPPYIVRDKAFEHADREAFIEKSRFKKKSELFFNALRARRFDLIFKKISKKKK